MEPHRRGIEVDVDATDVVVARQARVCLHFREAAQDQTWGSGLGVEAEVVELELVGRAVVVPGQPSLGPLRPAQASAVRGAALVQSSVEGLDALRSPEATTDGSGARRAMRATAGRARRGRQTRGEGPGAAAVRPDTRCSRVAVAVRPDCEPGSPELRRLHGFQTRTSCALHQGRRSDSRPSCRA